LPHLKHDPVSLVNNVDALNMTVHAVAGVQEYLHVLCLKIAAHFLKRLAQRHYNNLPHANTSWR